MIIFIKDSDVLSNVITEKVYSHNKDNILAFRRGDYLFVFNFHPSKSFTDYKIPVTGRYIMVFDTDRKEFGGYDHIDRNMLYISSRAPGEKLNSPLKISLYLPARTGIVFKIAPVRRINLST